MNMVTADGVDVIYADVLGTNTEPHIVWGKNREKNLSMWKTNSVVRYLHRHSRSNVSAIVQVSYREFFFHLFFNIIFIVKRWHSSRDVSTEWSEPQENLRIWWDSKLRPQLFAGICSTTEHTCPELDTRELNHIISSFRRINSTYIYKNDSNGGCVGSVTRFIGNLTDLVKPCVDSFVVYLQGRI